MVETTNKLDEIELRVDGIRASMLHRFDDVERTMDNLADAIRFILRKLIDLEDSKAAPQEEAPLMR